MDRFVVGTGRCGSTLLSQMLGESPEVTSIFEFFNGLDMTRRFSEEPASGEAFADLVSQPHPFVTMVLSRGYEVPEIVYPFGPDSRYQRSDGLPWLLVSALSRLSDTPDALFDAALDFARRQPTRPLREHYRALFDWLTEQTGPTDWTGGRVWIERSGSSIDYVAQLKTLFPAARFVHIHRDGREAALSIREHHAFRLAVTLSTAHLRGEEPPSLEDLRGLESGDDDDAIGRQLKLRPDASHFGAWWTRQIEQGMAALAEIDPGEQLEVRFEDLLERPDAELRRIAAFFALDPAAGNWLGRAAALISGRPEPRREKLPPDERARLDAACRPGMERLGRDENAGGTGA